MSDELNRIADALERLVPAPVDLPDLSKQMFSFGMFDQIVSKKYRASIMLILIFCEELIVQKKHY